jgi:ribosomal protein S18 acetylase RimI-like enzyme
MSDITFRNYTPADGAQIVDLQMRYAQVFPEAKVIPASVYNHPNFANGANILCVVDAVGRLVGYAPIYPIPILDAASHDPHVIWTEAKVDPGLENAGAVKAMLWGKLIDRVREIKAGLPTRRTELRFEYLMSESDAIAYVRAKGCVHYESVYQMVRKLAEPVAVLPLPTGVTARTWHMDNEPEQRRYLDARNSAFPEAPGDLAGLRYFMGSPMWAVGTACTAFAGEEIAGSVMAYWNAEENLRSGRRAGTIDCVFVVPAWRKRGIGRALIAQALLYLREHGLEVAYLEVRTSNADALTIYESAAFQVVSQSLLFALSV